MTKPENYDDAESQNMFTDCDSGGESIVVQCKNETIVPDAELSFQTQNCRSRRSLLMAEIAAILVFVIVIVIVILASPDNKMVTTNPLVHQPVHQPVFSEKSYCPTMDVFFIKIVSWTSTSSQSLAWPTVLRYVAASFAKPFTLE
jgi:hypothetical protein